MLKNISSCIYFIFTDQTYLVTNCRAYASLHLQFRHQIIHPTFNIKIVYPPRYQCLICNYKRLEIKSIKESFKLVNWEKLCSYVAISRFSLLGDWWEPRTHPNSHHPKKKVSPQQNFSSPHPQQGEFPSTP